MFFLLIFGTRFDIVSQKTMMLHTDTAKYFFPFFFSMLVFMPGLYGQTDTIVNTVQASIDSAAVADTTAPNKQAYKIDTLSVESSGSGIDAPIKYEASDSISYRIATNKIYVYDKGVVQYQDLELNADYVDIDFSKHEVKAHGAIDSTGKMTSKPMFKQGEDVYNPDTMKYNFESKKGYAYNVKTDQEGGYLHGKKVKMHSNKEIHMKGGKYTTCDHDEPHFYINMSKAIVIPKNKVVSGPAYMVIEGIPIPLILPFGFFPITDKKRSGILIPSPGERRGYGFYLRDLGLYVSWNDYIDFVLKTSVYTLGSWDANLSSRYVKRYRYRGSFSAEYSSIKLDEERIPGNINLNWQHSQDAKATPGMTFSSNVNIKTPGFNQFSSKTQEERYEQRIGSSISISKKLSKLLSMSASVTHNQNLYDSTISLTLPALKLNMNNTRLSNILQGDRQAKFKLLDKINISYRSELKNQLPTTKIDSAFWSAETLDLFEYAMQHQAGVSTSFGVLKFININPSVNYTERWYFSKVDKHYNPLWATVDSRNNGVISDTTYGFNRVSDISYSASASTKLYGMYNFGNAPLRAIRHIASPSVSFSYSPGYGNSKYYSTFVGENGKVIPYSRYEGFMYYSVPEDLSMELNFGINNNFEAKIRNRKDTIKGTQIIKLIESLSIRSGYDFARDSLQFDKITINANTTLFKLLRISFTRKVDPYVLMRDSTNAERRKNEFVLDRYNRLVMKDDDQWSFSASISLNSAKLRGKDAKKHKAENALEIPWNLSLSYSYTKTTNYEYAQSYQPEDEISRISNNNLSLRGNLKPTQNWSLDFSTEWDFTSNSITSARLGINRDLHCWQMGMVWIPMGSHQGYQFKLNVKADVFKDLKYEKNENYGEVVF